MAIAWDGPCASLANAEAACQTLKTVRMVKIMRMREAGSPTESKILERFG